MHFLTPTLLFFLVLVHSSCSHKSISRAEKTSSSIERKRAIFEGSQGEKRIPASQPSFNFLAEVGPRSGIIRGDDGYHYLIIDGSAAQFIFDRANEI